MKINWALVFIAILMAVYLVAMASGPHYGNYYRLPR